MELVERRPELLAQRLEWQEQGLKLRRMHSHRREAQTPCKLYRCERCGCDETRLWRHQRKVAVDRFTQYAQCIACNLKWEIA